ncbi:DUF1642 domain-containing protein [Streptococcus suis]|uniref:Phage protein n=1 Tax=Streptococcus suis TaxID=1307 RepID=A0A0Z8CJK8_STRSU|nr:DUF1642 domain-containing protein [Streptococcus suis]NQH92504.1 DUF1642 domain-containing protein [Streptococcus suis]NQI12266.1 DUF1642 domain-containing protein [Streptococcus suis]CYU26463.1 phage protein [Streptococcus suis]CYU49312.1 phage protein [Streptococcus suis]
MNKQELEKQAEALYTDVRSFLDNTFELIDQIQEPTKVVVPKHIAEKIEYCKDTEGYGLFHAMDYCYNYKDSADWLECNEETFARAWYDGFEIEKEQLYTVEIPNNGGTLVLASINHAIKLVDGNKHFPGKFTKESIEYAGFGWVFDCDGVKVVKVVEVE